MDVLNDRSMNRLIIDRIQWSAFERVPSSLTDSEQELISLVLSAYKKDRVASQSKLSTYINAGGSVGTLLAATSLLMSSRGSAGAATLIEVLDEHFVGSEQDRQSFSEYRLPIGESQAGNSPPANWSKPLAWGSPEALAAYFNSRHLAWNQPELPERLAHLVLIGINTTDFLSEFVRHHAGLALEAGASAQQIIDSAVLAIPIAGITSWYSVGAGIAELLDSIEAFAG